MLKFKAALMGAVFVAVAASPAYAITNFTWNPSGAGISTAGPFTADNITIKDYAILNIPANPTVPGSITENGTLAFTSFGGLIGTTPGFVNGTGNPANAIAGATPYQLYITFNSTSHLTPVGPNFLVGAFDSLSYTLKGDAGGNCDFSPAGVTGCGADLQVTLASGVLGNGANTVSIINGFPSATVDLSFNPAAAAAGFFVAPTNVTLTMSGSFTNTCGAVGGTQVGAICNLPDPNKITINGGGGNLDFTATPNRVPEPGTLWLLGAGLLGLAGMARKRARS